MRHEAPAFYEDLNNIASQRLLPEFQSYLRQQPKATETRPNLQLKKEDEYVWQLYDA
jgi:hypothetical protein